MVKRERNIGESVIISWEINKKWVPVSLTGKVFNGCIRALGFNPCLH